MLMYSNLNDKTKDKLGRKKGSSNQMELTLPVPVIPDEAKKLN